jgi:hypothetical protein
MSSLSMLVPLYNEDVLYAVRSDDIAEEVSRTRKTSRLSVPEACLDSVQ